MPESEPVLSVTGVPIKQDDKEINIDNEFSKAFEEADWALLEKDEEVGHLVPKLKTEELTPKLMKSMEPWPSALLEALYDVGISGAAAERICDILRPPNVESDDDDDDDNRIVDITEIVNSDATATPAETAEEKWAMSQEEIELFVVERAPDARKYANDLFKRGKLEEAGHAYRKLLTFPDADRVALNNNLAAVRIKQERWQEAIAACNRVLNLEPSNVKAFYRKAQGLKGLKELEAALDVIAKAVVAGAGKPNKELDELLERVKEQIADRDEEAAAREYERSKKRYIKRMIERQQEQREKDIKAGKIDPEAEERARVEARIAKENSASAVRKRELAARKEMLRAAAREEADHPILKETGKVLRWPPLPEATSTLEEGIGDRDMTKWFKSRLIQRLKHPDNRCVMHYCQGYAELSELDDEALFIEATIVAAEGGKRGLYYDIQLKANCLCAFLINSVYLQFMVELKLSNVDNTTEEKEDEWKLEAKVVNELKDKGDPRIPVYMKEHVEEYYLDHFKKQVKDGIFGLRNKCYNALLKGTAPKPMEVVAPKEPEPVAL